MEENTEIQNPGTKLAIQAVVSLITGILAHAMLLFHSWINVSLLTALFLAPISAIVAIVTGSMAKRMIQQSQGMYTGTKMANTGLWLGWIYIIVSILILILFIILGAAIISTITGLLG